MTKLLIKLFIKNNNDTANSTVRGKYIKLGTIVGLFCNVFLFIVKLIAGIFTNSVSIIADAVNNLTDTASSIISYLGFRLSLKPADKEHPFGHGRIEYMSALVVGVIIILVGFELFKSSIGKIITPTAINFSISTIIVLVVSILIKCWMFLFDKKIGKTIDSKALIATAYDSLSDTVITASVLAAVIVFLLFRINIDGYICLVLSCFIIFSGIKNIKETLDPLLGTPPDKKTIDEIKKTVLSYPDFRGMHDLIVHNYGPGRTFASLHVEVPQNIDILKCHEEIDECEKKLSDKLNAHIIIHYDPIVTDDIEVIKTQDLVTSTLKAFNSGFSIHDFRVVNKENMINLIFDLAVPDGTKLTDGEIKDTVYVLLARLDKRFNPIITIDRNSNNE